MTRFANVEQGLRVVLVALIWTTNEAPARQALLWQTSLKSFRFDPQVLMPPHFDANGVDEALTLLDRLSPLLKKALTATLADIVLADSKVNTAEEYLLRAICERINVPLPLPLPLLA